MTAGAALSPGRTASLTGLPQFVAVGSVLGAMVLVVLDAAIANIALPSIGHALGAPPSRSVGVVTAYQLGLITSLLPAAAFGESVGYQRVFMIGTALFAAASLACAVSPSLSWLVAARFVQGMGGASIMALGVALLRLVVPPDRLGAAIGWNAMAVALASATGPTIGALILSVAPWPWLFAVNLPVGTGVLLAARSLPGVAGTGRPVDMISAALCASTLALTVAGGELLRAHPVASASLFCGSAGVGIMLVRRDARHQAPIVPVDLLAQPVFRLSMIASVLCFVGQASGMIALPFLLQRQLGLSPMMAGLLLTPWPLTVAVTGPLAGRLANRISTSWLCLAGGMLLALGLASVDLLPLITHPKLIVISMLLSGAGFGLFNVPNNRNMFLSAPAQRSGSAGGLQGMARLSGQTIGAIAMTLLFQLAPGMAAPRMGLALGTAMTLAAGLLSGMRATGPVASTKEAEITT